MIQIVSFLTICGVVSYLFVLARRVANSKLPPQPAPRPLRERLSWATARRSLLWAGALAFIVACEALLPSLPLTGLERPQPATPHRYLGDLAMQGAEGPVSYDDMAQGAPWLWSLGTISRPEMERRIAGDLALLEVRSAQMAGLGNALNPASVYTFPARMREGALGLLQAALIHAQEDLDRLFDDADSRVTVSEADRYVINRLQMTANRIAEDAGRAYREATDARMAYMDAKGLEPDDVSDPEYARMREIETEASTARIVIDSLSYRIPSVEPTRTGMRPLPAPDAPFAHFGAPLVLYEEARSAPIFGEPITGPRAAFSFAGSARSLWQAASGHRRASSRQTDLQYCAVLPSGMRLCETAAVLPIDYDLTGTDCSAASLPVGPVEDLGLPGTRMAEGACKEAWIYPHVNIIYGTSSFTVHAPLPQGIAPGSAAGAPLSRWSAVWQGQTKVLAPSATFDWNARDEVLAGLELVHGVQPQIGTPRIWRDFGRDHTSPVAFALDWPRAQARHGYTPQRITRLGQFQRAEIAPMILWPDAGDSVEGPAPDWRTALLRRKLADRAYALNHWAQFAPSGGQSIAVTSRASPSVDTLTLGQGCAYFQFTLRRSDIDDMLEEVREQLAGADGGTCDAITSYGAVIAALERGMEGGSWLWAIVQE